MATATAPGLAVRRLADVVGVADGGRGGWEFCTSPVLAGLGAFVVATVELLDDRTEPAVVALGVVVVLEDLAGTVVPAVGRLVTAGRVVVPGFVTVVGVVAVWLLHEQAAKALARAMNAAPALAYRLSRTVGLAMSPPPSSW